MIKKDIESLAGQVCTDTCMKQRCNRVGLIFFGRGFNFEIFLDIYFLRIIKNSWLLWRLFAARDVPLGHSMCSTFLYCIKNEDLIMKYVCFIVLTQWQ